MNISKRVKIRSIVGRIFLILTIIINILFAPVYLFSNNFWPIVLVAVNFGALVIIEEIFTGKGEIDYRGRWIEVENLPSGSFWKVVSVLTNFEHTSFLQEVYEDRTSRGIKRNFCSYGSEGRFVNHNKIEGLVEGDVLVVEGCDDTTAYKRFKKLS